MNLEREIGLSPSDALIIIDVQIDFLPGGALAVEGGDEIIDGINRVAAKFKKAGAKIVLTQDWHPTNHKSFASAHPGMRPFDEYLARGIGPVLWPDHCVQGQKGAEFSPLLKTELADKTVKKGMNPVIDSYSGFLDNDKKSETGLAGYLNSLKIKKLFICFFFHN